MQAPRSLFFLLPGFLFVPGLVAFNALVFDQGLGDVLTTSLVGIVFYPAYLAMIAAVTGHFRPALALWPIAMIAGAELLSVIPGLAPDELVGRMLSPLYPDVQVAVLGKSGILLLAGLMCLASMTRGITLFRLIAATLSLAQCTVLVLFHLALITWPFEGMVEAETHLVSGITERDGSLSALCDGSDRICFRGSIAAAGEWASQAFRQDGRILSFLVDTEALEQVRFTWIENPSPSSLDRVDLATAMKHAPDDVEIMLARSGPTALYDRLRSGAGLLIVAFHQVWITLALAILARHGHYRFTLSGWRKDGCRS